jgi:hypothetical protein
MTLTGRSATSATRSEPYLWLHLAGIAALPLCLEVCLAGLRASSALPVKVTLLLVALAGIGPVVWMQWQRPFCVFSLVVLALKPEQLSETQRRILAQFKAPIGKIITVIIAGLALVILWQLGQWIPSIRPVQFAGGSFGGLLVAMVSFLIANLVLQVPASVLPVLLTPDSRLMPPYPAAKIPQDFTLIGLRVKQILPVAVPAIVPATAGSAMSAPVKPTVPASSIAVEAVQPQDSEAVLEAVVEAPAIALIVEPVISKDSSPLISVAIPETAELSVDPINLQSEPVIIHSLTELIPPEFQVGSAPDTIPQVSDTVVTINAPARVLNVLVAVSMPAAEPAEPHVRNTVVRVVL